MKQTNIRTDTILRTLRTIEKEPLNIHNMSKINDITYSYLSKIMPELEKMKLIKIKINPENKREKIIQITEEGLIYLSLFKTRKTTTKSYEVKSVKPL